MAITLADAKVTMVDKVDQAVVDEFRRESILLDKLTFDNSVSPGTGGSTLTYGYTRLLTPSTAGSRALNTEYTPSEAKKIKCTAELKIFGGSFNVDRVVQNTSGNLDEIAFQVKQKVKASKNYFHYTAIHGDTALNGDEFDGLDAILTGSSTEYKEVCGFDLSTSDLLDANYRRTLDILDDFLSGLDGTPDFLMGNSKIINKLQAVARRAGYFTESEDSFGRKVTGYNGSIFLDLGKYFNGTSTVDVAGTYSAEIDGEEETGLCDLYAVSLGLDAFHGISPEGDKILKTYLPDMKSPGALKTGEVEFVAGVVLKNTLKAGVMRGIKCV